MTLWGSGSCPTVPTAVSTDAPANRITLTISDAYEDACTADLGPYTSIVKLDKDLTANEAVDLILVQENHPDVALRL